MKADNHVVSVVIPARHTGIPGASLDRCQEALARQSRAPDEVVIVKDVESRGPAWGRNEGILRAKGDLIAFLDDDCQPPEIWLETLIEAVDRHQADGAGGTYEETDPFLWEWRRRQAFPETEQLDETGLVGIGGNLLLRRSYLERIEKLDGYVFNEAFRNASEDWELSWRLRTQGASFIFIPLKVNHLKQVTLSSYLLGQFGRGIGISMLFRTHRLRGGGKGMNQSLLWGQDTKSGANFLKVIWRKVIGPFDWQSFSTIRYFALFWLGEKSQSAGFLWGLLRKKHLPLHMPERERKRCPIQ